jgi:hypothetical protein
MGYKLDRIESNLRALFEEKLFMIFKGGHQNPEIVRNFITTMRNNQKELQDGSIFLPDHLQIHVAEKDFEAWTTHQDILDHLALSIHQTFLNEGYQFFKPLKISVTENRSLAENDYHISSQFSDELSELPDTSAIERSPQDQVRGHIPENACFVVGGKSNFILDKKIMNIGRHSENDLILADPHVSRHHAQLRVINGQYVIFDTGSTGGVYLNGKKVSQASLQSGDVVRIGLSNLIYIQDSTSENPTTALPADWDD